MTNFITFAIVALLMVGATLVPSVTAYEIVGCAYDHDIPDVLRARTLPAPIMVPDLTACDMDPPSQCLMGECLFNGCWDKLPRKVIGSLTSPEREVYVPSYDGKPCMGARDHVCRQGTCTFDPRYAGPSYSNTELPSFGYAFRHPDDEDYDSSTLMDYLVPPRGSRCAQSKECTDYFTSVLTPMTQKPAHLTEEIKTMECLRIASDFEYYRTTFINPLIDGSACGLFERGECFSGKCYESTFPPYCSALCTAGESCDHPGLEECVGEAPLSARVFAGERLEA